MRILVGRIVDVTVISLNIKNIRSDDKSEKYWIEIFQLQFTRQIILFDKKSFVYVTLFRQNLISLGKQHFSTSEFASWDYYNYL